MFSLDAAGLVKEPSPQAAARSSQDSDSFLVSIPPSLLMKTQSHIVRSRSPKLSI